MLSVIAQSPHLFVWYSQCWCRAVAPSLGALASLPQGSAGSAAGDQVIQSHRTPSSGMLCPAAGVSLQNITQEQHKEGDGKDEGLCFREHDRK